MPTGLSTHEKLAALHGYDLALLKELQEFQVLDAQAVLSVKIYLAGEESIKVICFPSTPSQGYHFVGNSA